VFSASWVSRCLDRSAAATAASAMMGGAISRNWCASYHWKARHDHAHARNSLPEFARCMQCESRSQGAPDFSTPRLQVFFALLRALSTPRAFPFVLDLRCHRPGTPADPNLGIDYPRPDHCGRCAPPSMGWTLSRGTNPIGWLRFIAEVSRGDRISVSQFCTFLALLRRTSGALLSD